MPPRPPLFLSSSFSLLPSSDGRSSIDQGSRPGAMSYKQITENKAVDNTGTHIASQYHRNSLEKTVPCDDCSSFSYLDYGGAGIYSKPHTGRISINPFSRHSDFTPAAATHETMASEQSRLQPRNNENMTRRIGTRLAASYIFRQLVYIITIGLILWVPGLLALLVYGAAPRNRFNRPTILSVGLFWWSVWLSSAWVAIWVCSLVATFTPSLLRRFLGILAIAFKDVILYAEATKRYVAFLLWSIVTWVVYLSTVWSQFPGSNAVGGSTINPLKGSGNNTATSSTASPLSSLLSLVPSELIGGTTPDLSLAALQSHEAWLVSLSRFLAGIIICSAILLVEKVAMQWVALSFHQTTYSDRIEQSNYHVSVLTILYTSASHSPLVTSDSLSAQDMTDDKTHGNLSTVLARAQKFKKALTSHYDGRQSTLGMISASLPLQPSEFPFSEQAIVESALESAAQSKRLAKQIFLAFAKSKDVKTGDTVLTEHDIAAVFKAEGDSQRAFEILDRDNNESCTWEEMQASILAMHQERICLLASLHDVDSAVLKLDNFFMSLYAFISCVIIAALLSTKFSTLVASLGTILLGLSWLVGSTAQESLSSIVWVFGKHPIDVGDTVEIPGMLVASSTNERDNVFVVEEIQLLSTILKTSTGKQVSISNAQLAQKAILNLRRSGPTRENIIIVVDYSTPLETIEKLRIEMIKWIDTQARDFLPGLNVELNALGDQSQLSLTLDVRYKTNWQDEQLKAIRKNRWVAALKSILSQLKINGPNGDSNKSQSVPSASDDLGRVTSFSLMDERNAIGEGRMARRKMSAEGLQPTSRLNEAMPSSASSRRHSNPTTQVTSLTVEGRRGRYEEVHDLERGPISP